MIFAAQSTIAQNRNQLKGPKAKNYKPWMNKEQSNTPFVFKNIEAKKGPKAKNDKIWSEENKNAPTTAVKAGSKRNNLKGPAAKNFKHWEKRNQAN
jgi:hypothetical protein